MTVRVIKCDCTSDRRGNTAAARYQDVRYGKGRRLANKCNSKDATGKYRCTVCSAEVRV